MSCRNFAGIQRWKLRSGDHPPTPFRGLEEGPGEGPARSPRHPTASGPGPCSLAQQAAAAAPWEGPRRAQEAGGLVDLSVGLGRGGVGGDKGAAGRIWSGRAGAARGRQRGVGRFFPSPLPCSRPPSLPPHLVKSPFVWEEWRRRREAEEEPPWLRRARPPAPSGSD